MGQGSDTLHEPAEKLSAAVIDRHRAIQSWMEELEGSTGTTSASPPAKTTSYAPILAHNRDEEKEHAAWFWSGCAATTRVRQEKLREYLFTEGSIHRA